MIFGTVAFSASLAVAAVATIHFMIFLVDAAREIKNKIVR